MSFVVSTPTGQIGSQVVRGLIRAGERPSVIVRDPSRLAADVLPFVKVFQGSLDDVEVVARALEGAKAVFWLTPPNYGSNDPFADYARYAQTLVDAAKLSSAPHIVHLSSDGAQYRHGLGLIDAVAASELTLDTLGGNVLHLRPGFFYENFLWQVEPIRSGHVFQAVPGETVTNFVATADIAEVAVLRMLARNWTGTEAQLIHGPERLSFLQVTAALSAGIGKPIQYVEASDEDTKAGFMATGGSEAVAEPYVQMFRAMRGAPSIPDPRTPFTTGRTTVADWAFRVLRPIVG